jgi:DNA repair exonuclease SbcCD ATPase subunit
LDVQPEKETLEVLQQERPQMEESAETYLSRTVRRIRNDLAEDRQARTDREIERLDEYAASERARLQSFIEKYREQQEEGVDMDISIRRQEKRLEDLQSRVQTRKENVRQKGRVVSLAPELVNVCYAMPA